MPNVMDACAFARSKNAGPYMITIDLFFHGRSDYAHAYAAGDWWRQIASDEYGVPIEDIAMFWLPSVDAMKLSFPRPVAGSVGERDMAGGQQFSRLMHYHLPS